MKRSGILLLLLGVAVVVGLAACQGTTPPATPATRTAPTPAAASEPPAYVIGVGDMLRVSVWKDDDLDVTVPVRPDGRISLPLLGDRMAAGLTIEGLRRQLTEDYAAFVTAPVVSVVLTQLRSNRAYVSGEVSNPGPIDLLDDTRLMQAIALAGGLTPYAKQGKVVVLRVAGGRPRRIEVDLGAIVSGQRPTDNLILAPGDTVIVP